MKRLAADSLPQTRRFFFFMYSSTGDGGAAATEAARQASINQGMTTINRTFDGGTWGTGAATNYTPGTTYYNAQGQVWSPPAGTNATQAGEEAAKAGDLFTGTQTSKGFGQPQYAQIGQDYLSYETPQMMDQYNQTAHSLAYGLARNGILNSGAAVNDNAALAKELSNQQGQLAQNAAGQENQLQTQVQNTRSNLVNQLVASADPSLTSEQAAAATSSLRAPTAFGPIGNLFGDFTNTYLANMNANAYNPNALNINKLLGS